MVLAHVNTVDIQINTFDELKFCISAFKAKLKKKISHIHDTEKAYQIKTMHVALSQKAEKNNSQCIKNCFEGTTCILWARDIL